MERSPEHSQKVVFWKVWLWSKQGRGEEGVGQDQEGTHGGKIIIITVIESSQDMSELWNLGKIVLYKLYF